MRNIRTFENDPVITPLSPIFKYHILETYVEDLNYIKTLEDFILSNELNIIANLPPTGDGNTGLGDSSLTSRFASINFFKCSEFNFLKTMIKEEVKEYLKYIGSPQFDEPLYGQCWANVMRPGEQILKHQHGSSGAHCFLDGNLIVKTSGSHTYYCDRYDTNNKIISENIVGKLTLFPSFIEHGTSKVEDDIRISVAFDIITEKTINFFISNGLEKYDKEHWVEI
jgi:hypothetical protein